MGLTNGLISGFAFLVGGLWLSPDLDTKTIALKRWGIFQSLWWPYRKLVPHRSIFSHGPFIGTALRLSYLIIIITLIILILRPLGMPSPIEIAYLIKEQLKQHPKKIFALILGLEASVWLHLLQDGDPMPMEWQKWIRR